MGYGYENTVERAINHILKAAKLVTRLPDDGSNGKLTVLTRLMEAKMWLNEISGINAAMLEIVNEYQSRLEKGGDPPLAPLGDPIDVPVHPMEATAGSAQIRMPGQDAREKSI